MDFAPTGVLQEALAAQNEQLKTQLMATSLINEITKVMLASPELDSVFKTIILGIQETLGFERVILFDIDKESFCLRPRIWTGVDDEKIRSVEIPLGFMGGSTSDAVFLNKHIIVDIVDSDVDPVAALATKAYVAIPLVAKVSKSCRDFFQCESVECPAYSSYNPCCWSVFGSGPRREETTEDERRQACLNCDFFKCVGVLWMDKPNSDVLVTSDQMTTLTTLAYQAGIIIDNFQMYEAVENANKSLKDINERLAEVNHDLSRAQAKINKDLDQARVIQTGLLPTEFLDTGEIKVAARYIPASKVGGDYYDFFRVGESSFGLVVADVSGHGVAAAMIMAMTKVLLKTFSAQIPSQRQTLERINTIYQTEIKTDNFVTIFYGRIDTAARTFSFVSAGHNPIIYLSKKTNTVDLLKADGLFLGVFEDMMLKERERTYETGDRIVLYTDGLTEAENAKGEMYGLERLSEVSRKQAHLDPTALIDFVLSDLDAFTGGRNQEDDVTLLVIDF